MEMLENIKRQVTTVVQFVAPQGVFTHGEIFPGKLPISTIDELKALEVGIESTSGFPAMVCFNFTLYMNLFII